jgi:predicted LPLAT superfamily acyltransferase
MTHWSTQKEVAGGVWQMRFVFNLYRSLGPAGIRIILHLIVFFFFLFSPGTRRVSKYFLRAVARLEHLPAVTLKNVYRHFYCFAYALLEKVAAWSQQIMVKDLILKSADIKLLIEQLMDGQGAVILCSHLGNTEMLRALGSLEAGKSLPPFGINSIVDFSGTSKFNKLLAEINPASMLRLISASAIGANTVIELSHRLDKGDLVIIAADRTAAKNPSKTVALKFLGKEAYLPIGAFILASLMDAPLYHMFAVREKDLDLNSPYEFHVYKSKFDLSGSRKQRMLKIKGLMDEYIRHLEDLCRKHPYQWYNFFDFWKTPPREINTHTGESE